MNHPPAVPHYLFPRSNINKSGGNKLASCVVGTVFLLAVAAAAVAVYLFVFKPNPPLIAVNAVRFPTFSVSNGTVNFQFLQYVTVRNPNRDEFSHYDSSVELVMYSGRPVGTVFIPAGKIGGGSTQKLSAQFDLHEYPLRGATQTQSTMEIQTRMSLVGRVRVLKLFMHPVQTKVNCGVAIQLTTGTLLGFRC